MNKQYKKYIIILSTTELVICVVVVAILIYLAQDISSHNKGILEMLAVKDTEETMREKVDNLIVRIDNKRNITIKEVEKSMKLAVDSLTISEENEVIEKAYSLMNNLNKMEYGAPIHLIIKMSDNRVILAYAGQRRNISSEYNAAKEQELIGQSMIHHFITIGDTELFLFAKQDDVDEIVKHNLYHEIHSYVYDHNESYWVNEIINYEGGDKYAIRLINPSSAHMEGKYLSTNTPDAKGNLPYLEELSGIREKGEVVYSYYFKNPDNNEINYKMSYAKLYEPYDWIVATGKPMNDVFTYTEKLSLYSSKAVNSTMAICLSVMLSIFLVGLVVILINHKKYQKKVEKYVKAETQIDPLTGAYNRKTAEFFLKRKLENLKQDDEGSKPLLMMVDIDDFKKVNDTFGHNMGDLVLRKLSQAIMDNIRDTDRLFRWGGEEFLILCCDVNKEQQQKLGEKILNSVRIIEFEHDFCATISIGSSYFDKKDDTYLKVIKRADTALYHSKRTGKNKYTSYEMNILEIGDLMK